MRSRGSRVATSGASARLFCGRWASSRRTASIASASSRAARCATPLRPVCTPAPPSDSASTSSWVTALHDVGARDEHVARALDHHREVRHRRRVDRAAGARPEDDRDLGHDARREDVAQEDLRVTAERRDALLDARPARVVEADDRRADLHRQVHDLADLLGVRLGQRAAEDREVLAEDEDEPAVDGAVAGDDAVAEERAARSSPNSVARWVTKASSSTNDPSSSSRSRRSRAVSLPPRAGARPGPVPRPAVPRLAAARGARSARALVDTSGLLRLACVMSSLRKDAGVWRPS